MKKTFNLDGKLLKEAKEACGATTNSETVRLALEALIRRAANKRMQTLPGSEPDERPKPKRRIP